MRKTKTIPVPFVMDDRYVVLSSRQWTEVCDCLELPELRPYVPSYAGSYSRCVIIQDTIGM